MDFTLDPDRTSPADTPDRLLRWALRANAAFSAGSGLVLAVGAGWLDDRFGLDWRPLVAIGVALMGYGLLLARESGGSRLVETGRTAVVADLAWVVGATVLLLGFPTVMTTVGRVALTVATVAVADFALAQLVGLRRLRGAGV